MTTEVTWKSARRQDGQNGQSKQESIICENTGLSQKTTGRIDDVCANCYKSKRCFEQRGLCSEYRSIESIREEVQAVMQSAKASSSAGDSHDQAPGCPEDVDGDQARGEGLLLG